MDYPTHVTLLARLSDGVDPSAWSEFHRRYGNLILGFARRYGLQTVDCEDVAQEVLLALSQSMADFQYDPAKGKFRAFLRTLTVRTIFRRIRQKQASEVQCDIETADGGASSDDAIEALWEEQGQQYHISHAMQRPAPEFNEGARMAFRQYAL